MKMHASTSCLILLVALLVTECTPNAPEQGASTPTLIVASPSIATPTSSLLATQAPSTEITAITSPTIGVGSIYAYVDGSVLVAVPAGEFNMGSDGTDSPVRKVSLRDFWIHSTKVTNQQYAWCVNQGQCIPPNLTNNPMFQDQVQANDPVVGITYDQAAAYCRFVGGRLPTEAEWEKAARGPEGNKFPWGNAEPSCDLLNFNNCVGGMTNVISYPRGASYYGGLDFAGNAFEWVADWYDPNYYQIAPPDNPPGPETGTMRVIRSSTFLSTADQVALSHRYYNDPGTQRTDLSFRCVVDNPIQLAPVCEMAQTYGADASTASQISESCPVLDISQAPFCVGSSPTTNVTFSGPLDANIDSGSCSPSENPNLVTCQSPGAFVSITANCQINLPGSPSCQAGYSPQNNVCVANGSEGQCLAGWSYDSARRCCNTTSFAPACPVGTFYAENQKVCLPYPVQEIITVSQQVRYTSCNAPSTGGNEPSPTNTCKPLECSQSETWDPNLCCCTTNGSSCSQN